MSTRDFSNVQTQSAFFEALHNLLWNDAGLDPQKALEHMTFFFAYRLIEPQVESLGLPKCCKWSYMASQAGTQELFDVMKKAVNEFRRNPQTKPYFNPPSIAKATLIQRIVEKINELEVESLRETDTLGNIFEYMLSRGMSTMSDEGQYFTNRKICNLAFDLAYEIKKTVRRDDGSLCTFADFFCGTGGFASAYVNGVKRVDPTVDWQKDKESVYCLDKNLSSIQTTLLNMLITTGVPFNINKIKDHNSFQNNIVHQGMDSAGFIDTEFDFLFMNPPYGGDKTKGKEYRFKYTSGKGKDKTYLVNKEIQSIGIEDDDKVSAGVQLAMATLSKKGGVCCIVLPQGFFFGSSKKQIELRKRLIENFKVHYVVDIASGEFANTGTKTSMLVFEAGAGPTMSIAFVDINKTEICIAPLETCRSKSHSLNVGVYIQQSVSKPPTDDTKYLKMKDILVLRTGDYITKAKQAKTGFPVYGGGNAAYMTEQFNRCDKLVIAKDGVSERCVRYVIGKFFLNHHGWTFDVTSPDVSESYVNHWLATNQHVVYRLATGTAQKGISQQAFYDLEIPIPSLETQNCIVQPIDAWMGMARTEEKIVEQLERVLISQIVVMGMDAPRTALRNIVKANYGSSKTPDVEEGEYPLIGGGIKPVRCVGSWNTEANTVIVARSGTAGYVSMYDKKSYVQSYAFVLELLNDVTSSEFLYYTLKSNQEQLMGLGVGSVQNNLNRDVFLDYQIPLPPIEEQKTLECVFKEVQNKRKMINIYHTIAQQHIDKSIPRV